MGRMNSGSILLAFVAILCGLFGVYLFRRALRPSAVVATRQAKGTVVPMASRDLVAGRTVTLGDIALVRMSREQMKRRKITGMFMVDADQIIGRTLRQDLKRNATFDTDDFYPDGTGPGVAERLKPGQRAVTLSLPSESALIGFARSGQSVDVIFKAYGDGSGRQHNHNHRRRNDVYTRFGQNGFYNRYGTHPDYAGATANTQAVTLIEGVTILALGTDTVQSTDHKDTKPKSRSDDLVTVTLAVTPAGAEVLRMVEGRGDLSFALRSPNDSGTGEIIDDDELEDALGANLVARELEVYRGQRLQRLNFDPRGRLNFRVEQEQTAKQQDSKKEADDTARVEAHSDSTTR